MTDKKNEKKTPLFTSISDDNNLSAGVCGPDGCEIDWSKAKKNANSDKK